MPRVHLPFNEPHARFVASHQTFVSSRPILPGNHVRTTETVRSRFARASSGPIARVRGRSPRLAGFRPRFDASAASREKFERRFLGRTAAPPRHRATAPPRHRDTLRRRLQTNKLIGIDSAALSPSRHGKIPTEPGNRCLGGIYAGIVSRDLLSEKPAATGRKRRSVWRELGLGARLEFEAVQLS